MPQLPDCMLVDCEDQAVGMTCINHNASGITIAMMPMCNFHGQKLKTQDFVIRFNIDDNPEVEFVEEGKYLVQTDCTVSFAAVDEPD